MGKFVDLTGKRFGKLVVVRLTGEKKFGSGFEWECLCDCGNTTKVSSSSLGRRDRPTRSCGCLMLEKVTKHSMCKQGSRGEHPMYATWRSMKYRCSSVTTHDAHVYALSGITVCEKWKDFSGFLEDMLPTWKEGLSLDRIDGSKGYCKENCRWATYTEQNRNRRNNNNITFQGETKCIAEWATEKGIDVRTLNSRLRHGWPVEEALTLPPSKTRRRIRTPVVELEEETEELDL